MARDTERAALGIGVEEEVDLTATIHHLADQLGRNTEENQ